MAQVDGPVARQRERVEQAIERSRRDVEGRVAVVTGGARGLGKAIATGLLRAGAQVAAADKTWDGADEFRKELESSGRGMAVLMDVTDDSSLDAAYEGVIQRFGTTDVLVNNAALVSETLFAPFGRVKTEATLGCGRIRPRCRTRQLRQPSWRSRSTLGRRCAARE